MMPMCTTQRSHSIRLKAVFALKLYPSVSVRCGLATSAAALILMKSWSKALPSQCGFSFSRRRHSAASCRKMAWPIEKMSPVPQQA